MKKLLIQFSYLFSDKHKTANAVRTPAYSMEPASTHMPISIYISTQIT